MITVQSIALTSAKQWQFTWTNTSAAYYRIVLNGVQIDEVQPGTGSTQYLYSKNGYEVYPPPLEIMEATEVAPSENNQPFLVMQWYGEGPENVDHYIVYELLSSQWVQRSFVNETGEFIYSCTTPILADETTFQYKVVAVGDIQQESTELDFVINVIRPPISPEGSFVVGWNTATNTVVVSGS